MRHRASGAANLAARYFGGPVVNAGDGQHEHPTQALGDALTMIERKGQLEGLVVAIVGDVEHSRVARSNAWLLHKFGAEVRFVGPRTLIPSHTGMLPGKVFFDLPTGLEDADVVICDIGLPGMDGSAVARNIRKTPSGERAFLIALTGYGREEDQANSRDAGFSLHLTKPINFSDLRKVIAGLAPVA